MNTDLSKVILVLRVRADDYSEILSAAKTWSQNIGKHDHGLRLAILRVAAAYNKAFADQAIETTEGD